MEKEIKSILDDEKVLEYQKKLAELRKDGASKVTELSEMIYATNRNKMLDKKERSHIVDNLKSQLAKAKEIATQNKDKEKKIVVEAVAYVNKTSKPIEEEVTLANKASMKKKKESLSLELKEIKTKSIERKESLKASFKGSSKQLKEELSIIDYETKSAIFDAKRECNDFCDKCKAEVFQTFVDKVQVNRTLRNGKSNIAENRMLKRKAYVQNFKPKTFFMKNGLYIAIIVFFITCIILAPKLTGGSRLFTLPNILTILEQCSTRMFYALGVAGPILLAGTDLSIGRQVAMGSIVTGLILHPGVNIVKFFNWGPWDFSGMPMFARLILALLCSVTLCAFFSTLAGWFFAKLKMHPFVATLSTQLIIYGLLFYGTRGTPVGSIDSTIKDAIGGRWVIGMTSAGMLSIPKLIVPAVIAIIVAWFIWNKTTFGKNMYAVGDNSEAASVSGISVFKTTLLVFLMAGIFYGFGAFFEAFRANASAGTGQGYETDAIAACVVGGISFNGGIGKISGAVLGVIIFTALTYCLTFLGIDTNLQFVVKGLILLFAVAMDCLKYLKRK